MATDNIEIIDGALDYIGKVFKNSTIHVISIIDKTIYMKDSLEDIYNEFSRDRALDILAKAHMKFEEMGIAVDTVMLKGKPAKEVVNFIEKNDIDLLVTETYDSYGQQLKRAQPIIMGMVKHAPCPLLILNTPKDLREPKHILLVLEGSREYKPHQQIAAISYAKAYEGSLTVIHVFKNEKLRGINETHIKSTIVTIKAIAAENGITFDSKLEVGHPKDIIPEYARNYDLVVIDNVGKAPLNISTVVKKLLVTCSVPIAIEKE